MTFNKNLRHAREVAGLSQQELADIIGVYQKDIALWEKGDSSPDIVALANICRALRVSSDALLETEKE